MKNFLHIFIFFLLISIYLCEEKVLEEKKEEKKALSSKVYDYLVNLHIENMKTMTKEQLFKIFETLFTMGLSEIKLDQKTKESNLSLIRIFSEQIFDLLATKEKGVIEIDKIMEYFNIKNIKKYLDMMLKALGLDNLMESIGKPLLNILHNLFLSNEKNSEL